MSNEWISPWWQAVLLPDDWDVCGVSVPPLSVWHTFALENIGNRYLCGGPTDRDDAASLLLFAKHDMAGGRRLMQPQFVNFRARAMRKMHRQLDHVDALDIHTACSDYVTDCLRTVDRFEPKGGGKPCAVPYQWQLVRIVAISLSGSLESAWNTPYAVARCLVDAYAEWKGDTSLMTQAAQHMADTQTFEHQSEIGDVA